MNSNKLSTKFRILSKLEEVDQQIKEFINILQKKASAINLDQRIIILSSLNVEIISLYAAIDRQTHLQKKIDQLDEKINQVDKKINNCQIFFKKYEAIISTSLYYSRKKIESMANAIKNPIDSDELIKFAHKISASYGAVAPDNWMPGDPRRPYPNKEEIRRGYLGHLDDNGKFRNTLFDAINPTLNFIPSNNSMGSNMASGHRIINSNGSMDNFYSDNGAMSQTPNVSLPGVNMVSSPGTMRTNQANTSDQMLLSQQQAYNQNTNPTSGAYNDTYISGNDSISPNSMPMSNQSQQKMTQ